MRYMIDTNVILDVLLRRDPYYQHSRYVLDLCEQRKIEGFITSSSITDLFFIIRKSLHSREKTYRVISSICEIVKILSVTNDHVMAALQMQASDFEDCLMAECAAANGCDGIVTRNAKGFIGFGVRCISPEKFAEKH